MLYYYFICTVGSMCVTFDQPPPPPISFPCLPVSFFGFFFLLFFRFFFFFLFLLGATVLHLRVHKSIHVCFFPPSSSSPWVSCAFQIDCWLHSSNTMTFSLFIALISSYSLIWMKLWNSKWKKTLNIARDIHEHVQVGNAVECSSTNVEIINQICPFFAY